jgi:hypothetical protein
MVYRILLKVNPVHQALLITLRRHHLINVEGFHQRRIRIWNGNVQGANATIKVPPEGPPNDLKV